MATQGFISLKAAAEKISRSTARTRQFVAMGKFGAEGTGWIRNQMGNIEVRETAVAAFTPPERGNARAQGVQAGTKLRHVRVTQKLVMEAFKESDKRRIALEVLKALEMSLMNLQTSEEVKVAPKAAPSKVVEATPAEIEIEDAEDDELEDLLNT